MADVVEVDFGKELREASRAYCRLTGLVEKFAEEFARDPRKFLHHAHEEIVRLKIQIEDARDALRPRIYSYYPDEEIRTVSDDTIRVVKSEYERLKACAEIIRR